MHGQIATPILMAAAIALTGAAADAAPVTFADYDQINREIGHGTHSTSIAGTLDIGVGAADGGVTLGAPFYHRSRNFHDADGFRPGIDLAIGGRFYAALQDDALNCYGWYCGDMAEYVDIDLGGGHEPIGIYEIDADILDHPLGLTLTAGLNQTGQLDWRITVTDQYGWPSHYRDVVVAAVGLQVFAEQPIDNQEVPEPATLALVGAGLIGLATAARRLRRT